MIGSAFFILKVIPVIPYKDEDACLKNLFKSAERAIQASKSD